MYAITGIRGKVGGEVIRPSHTDTASLIEAGAPSQVIHSFLAAWRRGGFREAADHFIANFVFADHALGLEFRDRERLIEFLAKTYELFPDTVRSESKTFESAAYAISEWTLTATHSEPVWGGTRVMPISVRGVSVVRTENGKISEWCDYYDQVGSRRSSLASHFTEWIEL